MSCEFIIEDHRRRVPIIRLDVNQLSYGCKTYYQYLACYKYKKAIPGQRLYDDVVCLHTPAARPQFVNLRWIDRATDSSFQMNRTGDIGEYYG
jgi:hypothetical protein